LEQLPGTAAELRDVLLDAIGKDELYARLRRAVGKGKSFFTWDDRPMMVPSKEQVKEWIEVLRHINIGPVRNQSEWDRVWALGEIVEHLTALLATVVPMCELQGSNRVTAGDKAVYRSIIAAVLVVLRKKKEMEDMPKTHVSGVTELFLEAAAEVGPEQRKAGHQSGSRVQ